MQNALDAAVEAGRERAFIRFEVRDVPSDKIPGFSDYRHALKGVENFCSANNTLSGGVRNILRSLESASKKPKPRTLFVSDNGIGLDSKSMASMLNEGCSTKKMGGGSHGIGHQSSFGLSNLRYVLYGGLQKNGDRIAAGHAILGTQVPEGRKVTLTELPGKDGYLVKGFRDHDLFTAASMEKSQYIFFEGKEIPSLIADKLDAIQLASDGGSGSVIVIPGFNNFGLEERNADADKAVCETIIKVVAQNFFVAVASGKMRVDVNAGSTSISLEEGSIAYWLEKVSGQLIASTRGFPSGIAAHESFLTMREDSSERLLPATGDWGKVRLFLRLDTVRKKITLCRDGMWITDSLFRISEFESKVQFDALVLVDRHQASGQIGRVIRDAEPGHHNAVDPRLLEENREDKKLLRDFKKDLKDYLLKHVEDVSDKVHDLSEFMSIETGAVETKKVRSNPALPGPSPTPDFPDPDPKPKLDFVSIDLVRIPSDGGIVFSGKSKMEHSDLVFRISADAGADESCDSNHAEYIPLASAKLNDTPLEMVRPAGSPNRVEGFHIRHMPKGPFTINVALDTTSTSNLLTVYPRFYKPHRTSEMRSVKLGEGFREAK